VNVNSVSKLNKVVLVVGLAFGLTSCGGGGGGSSSIDDSNVTGVTVGGTAAKGIVKDGVVTAEELDAAGIVIATVGSATTGADGTYSLTLNNNYNGGPIQISITADANTQTKCDVLAGCGSRTDGLSDTNSTIDFGEFYKPAALTMTALIPVAASNETLSVSVTPFTHMAAVRARAATTLDADSIADANSEVSNLLGGIDILNTPPLDITDSAAVSGASSATQVTYAALASALSNQGLVDSSGQPDLNAAIELLAQSFVTGVILADDSGGDSTTQISLQEIVTAAQETFTAASIADTTGKLDGLQSGIDFAVSGDGTIDPTASTTAADSNLAKVKAMMSDVRTWANVIETETQAKSSAFDAQITLASDAIAILGTDDLIDSLDAAIDAVFEFDGTPTDLLSLVLPVNNFNGGTIDSPSAGVIVITGGVILGYTVDMTFNLPDDLTAGSNFSVGIQSATIVGADNSMTINSGLVDVTFVSPYTIDYDALDLGTAMPAPDVTDLIFDLDVAFTQNVNSSGVTLVNPVSFAGTMSFDLDIIPVINDVEDLVLPRTFSLSGTISNTAGESLVASLVGNVTNTAQFQFELFASEGTLYSASHATPFLEWAYTDTDSTDGLDTFTISSPNGTRIIYWDALSTAVFDTGNFGDFSFVGFFNSLGEYLALNPETGVNAEVDGEGSYFASFVGVNFSVDGTLDGFLLDPDLLDETAGNFIDADIGLTFTTQLTGLPLATINITADRTGFEAGNGALTISYGTRQLVIAANTSNINTDTAIGTITITNQDSIILELTLNGTLSGVLTFNGIQYATVNETASGFLKVSYVDGTFDIF